ncbi:MAG: DUF2752 domain-containing protein, partial [SAR324 cluster bacterium]|nr:DUF2752 domain-containing protein [SAR324 cluster bacterium]
MRVDFLMERKFDLEEIFILVSICIGFTALIWLFLGLPLPQCPFHALTGIPCLSCGASRAFREIINGNFTNALFVNPLFCLFLLGCMILNLYALTIVTLDL